jgi:hypothetical protein
MRAGLSPVPLHICIAICIAVQMWQGEPSPGADVARHGRNSRDLLRPSTNFACTTRAVGPSEQTPRSLRPSHRTARNRCKKGTARGACAVPAPMWQG